MGAATVFATGIATEPPATGIATELPASRGACSAMTVGLKYTTGAGSWMTGGAAYTTEGAGGWTTEYCGTLTYCTVCTGTRGSAGFGTAFFTARVFLGLASFLQQRKKMSAARRASRSRHP